MPRKGTRDLAKEQYWRGVIHEWRSSDRNVADFCRRHGYTYSQFQKWRRIIAQRDAEKTSVQRKSAASNGTRRLTARKIANSNQSSVQFVPAQITEPLPVSSDSSDETSIEVVLRCGIILRVTSACSPDSLLLFTSTPEIIWGQFAR